MSSKLALLELSPRCYALPVDRIVHILPASMPFALPLLRPGIIGAVVDGGEVVPVLHRAAIIADEGELSCGEAGLHVIYEAEVGRVALPADCVVQMVEKNQGTICAADVAANTVFKKIFRFQDREYPLVDIDELVAAP